MSPHTFVEINAQRGWKQRYYTRDPLPDFRSNPHEAPRHGKSKEDHSEIDGHEGRVRANLYLNLEPRTHVLGGKGATWGSVDVGGDGYKRGEGVDIRDVRSFPVVFARGAGSCEH